MPRTDRYAKVPAQLKACRRYMAALGKVDSEATREELADVIGIPLSRVETFSRYGHLAHPELEGRA